MRWANIVCCMRYILGGKFKAGTRHQVAVIDISFVGIPSFCWFFRKWISILVSFAQTKDSQRPFIDQWLCIVWTMDFKLRVWIWSFINKSFSNCPVSERATIQFFVSNCWMKSYFIVSLLDSIVFWIRFWLLGLSAFAGHSIPEGPIRKGNIITATHFLS